MLIEIDTVEANFTITDSVGCQPFFLNTTNQSINADQYQWFLNDQIISNAIEISQLNVQTPGFSSVQLVVQNPNNCTDTLTKQLYVHEPPAVSVQFDEVVCANSNFEVILETGSGIITDWQPTQFLIAQNNLQTTFSANENLDVQISITDSNQCVFALEPIQIAVQQPIELQAHADTTIVTGTTAYLYASSSDSILNPTWHPRFHYLRKLFGN